jgi:tetratricopeptide (TPR) repeat protein
VGSILTDYAVALSLAYPGHPRVGSMQRRAVAILRAAPGDHRERLAHALLVSARGRPPTEAIPRMREALALREGVHGRWHSAVADALSDLALATEAVDPLAADSLMQESLAIRIAIHGPQSGTLLGTMNNLAALRRDRGDYAGAELLYRKVLALREELYPEQQVAKAYTLYGLGIVLAEAGQPDEGESRLRQALAILEREWVPGHPLLALTRVGIGHALARQGRFADAERILLPASTQVLESPLNPMEKAKTLRRLVSLYQGWGRAARAERYQARLDSLAAEHQLSLSRSGES